MWGKGGQRQWLLLHVLRYLSSFPPYSTGDKFAANFLIKNGARVNAATLGDQETPLHLVASYNSKKHKPEVMSEMAQIAESLLRAGANPNMQDSQGRWLLGSLLFLYVWLLLMRLMGTYEAFPRLNILQKYLLQLSILSTFPNSALTFPSFLP